jgi:ABC-type glycerol-3-phosphate transport system substrate-binding protein
MDTDKDRLVAKELASKMTKRKKLSYIWHYYKMHIIITLFVLLAVTSVIVGKLNEKVNILNVTVLGSGVNLENFNKLSEKAYEQLVEDKKENEMLMTFENITGVTSAMGNQKLTVQIAAGELDVLILSKTGFTQLASSSAFIDLKELTGLSSDTSKELNYVLYKAENVDTNEKAYGIALNNFDVLKELDLADEEPVLAILANSKNQETAVKFIEWLYKQKSL